MKVLLIMPNFFDYPMMIIEELKNMGYEVDFYDDRPSTNAWVKAAIRINPNIVKKYIENYFDKMMSNVKNKKYDIVFLISGQSLSFSEEMISQLKVEQKQAKFVLYQWDSLNNFPYIKKIQKYFDYCYSFDRNDCALNNGLTFLPLFYSERYKKIGLFKEKQYEYDFSFVGTAHPKKYKFIGEMSNQLRKIYPKQFIYFFLPSPIVFFYRKITSKEMRKAHYNDFKYKSLCGKEIQELFVKSRCILDSPQAGQCGLTIRVIEALGAKKKIITTNSDVKNYDFYREENIYVYNGDFDMNSPFFKRDYIDIDRVVYEKYSLRNWLKVLLIDKDVQNEDCSN